MIVTGNMSERSERRKHLRFKVGEGAFAFINNIPFTIRNVSQGGMQLQSVVFDDTPPEDLFLDIFLKTENFYLQDVPVRLIRLKKTNAASPFGSMQVQCFGLQFGELTDQQKTRIDHFIAQSQTSID